MHHIHMYVQVTANKSSCSKAHDILTFMECRGGCLGERLGVASSSYPQLILADLNTSITAIDFVLVLVRITRPPTASKNRQFILRVSLFFPRSSAPVSRYWVAVERAMMRESGHY